MTFCPKQKGSKKYMLRVRVGGKDVHLGLFATAEEAALARARHLWDTTVRLLEPQPQQAPPQGAAGPSEASYYEEDGFDPADTADAVANSLLPDPPPAGPPPLVLLDESIHAIKMGFNERFMALREQLLWRMLSLVA